MIEMEIEIQQISQSEYQRLGIGWIRAIEKGSLEQIGLLCHPELISNVLTPDRSTTFERVEDLVNKFKIWFGDCTDMRLEDSRVNLIGQRLGIFYRFVLKEQDEWFRVEQQLYCTLQKGLVTHLQLLCSGFQPLKLHEQPDHSDPIQEEINNPPRDALLEFDIVTSEAVCSFLTPAIRSKIREIQFGQVLEVRVEDATARSDIESWCRLSGNTLLKVMNDEKQKTRFFIRKN